MGRLLGKQLRQPGEPHDVTADARAAMDLALYEQQKGPTPPLPAPDLQVLSLYIASRLQIARSSADAPHSTGNSVALHMLIATSRLRKWQLDTPIRSMDCLQLRAFARAPVVCQSSGASW